MIEIIEALVLLSKGVFDAAKCGQVLPILTITFIAQIILQLILIHLNTPITTFFTSISNDEQELSSTIINSSSSTTTTLTTTIIIFTIQQYNKILLVLNISIFLLPGYTLLLYLYQHSITTIFNRKIPSTIKQCIPSFIVHLQLLKPIEIIWRYCTMRFRVLPDIIVLGEVRCGTTSFCQQLSTVLNEVVIRDNIDDDMDEDDNNTHECEYFFKCHTPFCLWKHPELDHKETFFFVGHYLGLVSPECYKMCFPLYITKIWNEWYYELRYYLSFIITNHPNNKRRTKARRKKQKPLFVTFDGCAQYLSNPTTPYLIAAAYKLANQRPPILISCIRDPIHQTISWWKYENNAQQWGESMGLNEWNHDLRTMEYPPKSIKDALEFTQSNHVKNLYKKAEELYTMDDLLGGPTSTTTMCTATDKKRNLYIPSWAMSWPGGQLTGIGRNGKFVDNIMRYERVFGQAFDDGNDKSSTTSYAGNAKRKYEYGSLQSDGEDFSTTLNKSLKYVNILPIEYLSQESKLKEFMMSILKQVVERKDYESLERMNYEKALHYFESLQSKSLCNVHRNASPKTSSSRKSIDEDTFKLLKNFFS